MTEKGFHTTVKYGEGSTSYCVLRANSLAQIFDKVTKGLDIMDIKKIRIAPIKGSER